MRAIPFVDESRRLTQNDSTQNEVIFIHLLIMNHLEVPHIMWWDLGANQIIC